MRVESDRPSSAGDGGHWHPLPGQPWPGYVPGSYVERDVKEDPRHPRAALVRRNQVYTALISSLSLLPAHKEHLLGEKRQFTASKIEAREYRSIYCEGSYEEQESWAFELAKELESQFGDLAKIPGFGTREIFTNEGGDKAKIAGARMFEPRILVPVRSLEGMIEGFQVMNPFPKEDEGYKYVWFSGVAQDGASIGTPLHVSWPENTTSDDVILTEGPIKADIISERTGRICIAFQGVTCIDWESLGRILKELSPPRLLLAIDMDRLETDVPVKKNVADAHEALCAWCEDRGQPYAVSEWDWTVGKGLDDLLLAGGKATWTKHDPGPSAPPPPSDEDAPPVREEEERSTRFDVADERAFTEMAFVCAAWEHDGLSKALASYGEDRWVNPTAKAAALAIKDIVDSESKVDSISVGEAMRRAGNFQHWKRLASFHKEYETQVKPGQDSAFQAFREAVQNDEARSFLTERLQEVGTVPVEAILTRLKDEATELILRGKRGKTVPNFKSALQDYIERDSSGEVEKTRVKLPLIHRAIGPAGGGDVVFICGPPKIGKSGVLDEMIEGCARQGDVVLYGQLELRVDQICERKISRLLGKSAREASLKEKFSLLANGRLDHLENVLLAPRCTSLEEYRVTVSSILSRRPDVKVWATDYSEMLQSFDPRADQLGQTEAVSDFKKKTSTAYDVLGILLTQPNQSYYTDCDQSRKNAENKPKLHHWKRGSKFRQDAHALCFIHSCHKFDSSFPEDYLEFHIQLSRGSEPGIVPLRVNRETFTYKIWDGPVPHGGNRPLEDQIASENTALDTVAQAELF